jgi:hypothetical protein
MVKAPELKEWGLRAVFINDSPAPFFKFPVLAFIQGIGEIAAGIFLAKGNYGYLFLVRHGRIAKDGKFLQFDLNPLLTPIYLALLRGKFCEALTTALKFR